jgi:hypothetical protein
MSQYITKLRESANGQGDSGRDGIEWPTPVGTWKQSESLNRLETFANNLDVSQALGDTDLLNSVPTPWARLLLFESALYSEQHPAHADVEEQWRGLLGVIALAGPLRLDVKVQSVTLSQQAAQFDSRIAKSFGDLHPLDGADGGGGAGGAGKWDDFQMILVDDVVLGATSPRTLVFTGVAHQCPPSIPFRSAQGRLSDPVAYYRKFNDGFYLSLMARWIGGLIAALEQSPTMRDWLGTPPSAPGAAQRGRIESLIERLRGWLRELNGVAPASIMGNLPSRFTLAPYTLVTSLPDVPQESQSDLFIGGRRARDTIVCYRADGSAKLLNSFGQELVNEPLRVYNGRWIQANQPLPLPLNFLPDGIRRLEDPAALFEESLIQVALPVSPEAVHFLAIGDKRYLYPFKADILQYFSTAEIADNTALVPNAATNSLRVEFKIPVENNRTIKLSREYPLDTGVLADGDTITAELAAWPDFTCPAWTRYFYFKTISAATAGRKPIDFEPTISSISRSKSDHTWYATREPVRAFVGTVEGKSGLLLLRNNRIDAPTKFWKVSVDFGSTHTRAFSLDVDRHGDEAVGYSYVTSEGAPTQPVQFSWRGRDLTYCQPNVVKSRFFPLQNNPYLRSNMYELKTLLQLQEPGSGVLDSWLPREGYVYMHWLYDGDYNPNNLHFNLKWNSHKDDHDLRAFLRSLLVMLQAEAVSQGAQVVSVSHTYPSVFTESLIAKHNGEWSDLENYLNLGVLNSASKVRIEPAAVTETVAVCRHLEWEQQASPVSNTISLDVGGSTTDMAIWAQQRLEVQESVKLAAGIIGRYLQSPDAQQFLEWFETTMQAPPHKLKELSLSNFTAKPSGYSLMFTNVLSLVELRGQLKDLIDKVNGAQEARHFLSHIIYLFGSVLYYAGLLARKAGLPQQQDTYNVYFCGKGGTLFQWIHGYERLAEQMFVAGLRGPDGVVAGDAVTVFARMSRRPKEEVGRGLLAESELEGAQKRQRFGLLDPTTPSVTVGESGYGDLRWDDKLTPEAIMKLPVNVVPPLDELRELNTFLEAFRQGDATQKAAVELGLDKVSAGQFQSALLQRLFGASKGCIVSDVRKGDDDALIEPLFVTEIKVLLEAATQSIQMYP